MVIQEKSKSGRSVRPKISSNISNDENVQSIGKSDKKHRLKQRFEVIKKLGQGTYGKVQLAVNKETGQEVAIKTIKKSKIDTEQDLTRIRREIQIMSSIQHPHIIHIFEVFENKDKIVLVMQFASGGELYEYVSDRKMLTDAEARRLFRQIATAVYYCHKNKVCHRDLKLENILLDEKGNAKIGDFGLSNVFDEKHFLSTFCGSPLYASPEIVKGTPYYGPEVDCWSMGVLLYTLVYGAMPFDGSNFKKLVKQISESSYYEPKQKSDASTLIKKLLTVNPAKRATIIDICTDWWVNKGYEQSLLQVSEDLANLTPVRLDVLLALAPVSPTVDKEQVKLSDAAASVDMIGDLTNNTIQSDAKGKLESQPKEEGQSIKRQASNSIDQSTSKASITRKKKAKKSSDNSVQKTSLDAEKKEDQQPKLSNEQMEKEGTKTDNSENLDSNKIEISSMKENLASVENEINSKVKEALKEESNEQVNKVEENKSGDHVEAECSIGAINENNVIGNGDGNVPTIIDDKQTTQQESISNINVPENKVNNKKNDVMNLTQPEKSVEEKEAEKEVEKLAENQEKIVDQVVLNSEVKEKDDANEAKRKGSLIPPKRPGRPGPGRISIPNAFEPSDRIPRERGRFLTRRSNSLAGGDNKIKLFENQQKQEKRAPVIPSLKVKDAMKAIERRCSVPAASIIETLASVEQNEIKSQIANSSGGNQRVAEPLTSPEKVKDIERIFKKEKEELSKSVIEKQMEKKIDQKMIESAITESKLDTQISQEDSDEKKELAKSIIKKSIAKARLMEKRQISNDSDSGSGTSSTPLIGERDTCPLSPTSPLSPSYFKAPRPFIKEEMKPPKINSNFEINLTPQIENSKEAHIEEKILAGKEEDKNRPQKELISNESVEAESNKVEPTLAQPLKPTPIARSYKKVTFTKDGACVTETGKIYSTEGKDGTFTRIEKKSKVTHYPSKGDEHAEISTPIITSTTTQQPLQKSDSQSSSGSCDIFDDIFDDHWKENSVFPNINKMKSLFHGLSTNEGEKKSRRRSRAESCERSQDWYGSGFRRGNSRLIDHDSDDEKVEKEDKDERKVGSEFGSAGLWQFLRPQTSLFDRSSLFSRHFKHDKDIFGNFDEKFGDESGVSASNDRPFMWQHQSPFNSSAFDRLSRQASRISDEQKGKHSTSFDFMTKNVKPDVLSRHFSKEAPETERYIPIEVEKDDNLNASRRRVEQWLREDKLDDDEFNAKNISNISKYATMRPNEFNRFMKSGKMTANENVVRDKIRGDKPLFEMSFTFNPGVVTNNKTTFSSPSPTSSSPRNERQSSILSEPSEVLDFDSILPESSSLLEQLRTHGYRNIVQQRISTPPSPFTSDGEWKSMDSSNEAANNKRGKSLLNSSSSIPQPMRDAEACVKVIAGLNAVNKKCMPIICDSTNSNSATINLTIINDEAIASHANHASHDICPDISTCMPITNANPSAIDMTCTSIAPNESTSHVLELLPKLKPSNTTQTQFAVNANLKHDTVNQQTPCDDQTRSSSSRVTTKTACQNSNNCDDDLHPNQSKSNHPDLQTKTKTMTNKQTSHSLNDNHLHVPLKETVQERIHRKSFYSRFNDDRPFSSRNKRRTFFDERDENDLFLAMSPFRRTSSSSVTSSTSTTTPSSQSKSSLFSDEFNFVTSKPPKSTATSDWFQRMDSRASQLMDELNANEKRRTSNSNHYRRSSSLVRNSFSSQRSMDSTLSNMEYSNGSSKSDDSPDGDIYYQHFDKRRSNLKNGSALRSTSLDKVLSNAHEYVSGLNETDL